MVKDMLQSLACSKQMQEFIVHGDASKSGMSTASETKRNHCSIQHGHA